MEEIPRPYDYLEAYLDSLRAKGRYAFSWDEAKQAYNLTDKALNQNLFRLKVKQKVVQIRKGFYAVIPPEYAAQGMIPVPLFIDDMMGKLNHRYYIGLFSSAALHGAANQQLMETSVITGKPALRAINTKKLKVHFYTKNNWDDQDIVNMKTDTGYMNVASPELTALDLFYYIQSTGIKRVVPIIEELMEVLKPARLSPAAKRFSQTAAIQRLGFILETSFQHEELSFVLSKVLLTRRTFMIPLVPGKPASGKINPKWKIIENTDIYIEL